MTGLFIALATVLAVSSVFLAGFGVTAGLVWIFKGPEAARKFVEEEW